MLARKAHQKLETLPKAKERKTCKNMKGSKEHKKIKAR